MPQHNYPVKVYDIFIYTLNLFELGNFGLLIPNSIESIAEKRSRYNDERKSKFVIKYLYAYKMDLAFVPPKNRQEETVERSPEKQLFYKKKKLAKSSRIK